MEGDSRDPLDLVKKLAESYRGIKFGAGVVGKTSHATLALFGVWGIVLFRLSENLWLDIALIAVGAISTGVYVWWSKRTQDFAAANPGLALLEGAELIEYQKWEAEIKGFVGKINSPIIPSPHIPILGDAKKEGEKK